MAGSEEGTPALEAALESPEVAGAEVSVELPSVPDVLGAVVGEVGVTGGVTLGGAGGVLLDVEPLGGGVLVELDVG